MQFEKQHLLAERDGCPILLVGIGSAGCKALGALVRHGMELPDSIAVHTDLKALEASKAPRLFCIGDGFSSGGDVMKGRAHAEGAREKLREMFSSYKLIFFVCGLGGGTGNGATPVFVQLARELGAFSLCLTVMPFAFEGERKRLKAESGLATLSELSDGVIAFPNQRLFHLLDHEIPVGEALAHADMVLADSIMRLWHLLNEPGVMNLDFADVAALVKHSNGTCTLASVEKEGEDRIQTAVDAILTDVLFDRGTVISKARAILLGIIGGPDISLAEVERIHTMIGETCQNDVVFFSGISMRPGMEGRVSITVLASEMWIAPAPSAKGVAGEAVPVQADLGLDAVSPEAFPGTKVSIDNGENLDIPTFLRRGISLGGL